jgi:hypothetical protein
MQPFQLQEASRRHLRAGAPGMLQLRRPFLVRREQFQLERSEQVRAHPPESFEKVVPSLFSGL